MKKYIHKLMATFMACVVIFTTMSFTVDMHFCGDTLVDFSFVQSVKICGMDKLQPAAICENPIFSSKPCCSDEQVVKPAQEDLKISFDGFSLDQQYFIVAFTYSYSNLLEETVTEELSFNDYPPPFIQRDVQVLHQTYLI